MGILMSFALARTLGSRQSTACQGQRHQGHSGDGLAFPLLPLPRPSPTGFSCTLESLLALAARQGAVPYSGQLMSRDLRINMCRYIDGSIDRYISPSVCLSVYPETDTHTRVVCVTACSMYTYTWCVYTHIGIFRRSHVRSAGRALSLRRPHVGGFRSGHCHKGRVCLTKKRD